MHRTLGLLTLSAVCVATSAAAQSSSLPIPLPATLLAQHAEDTTCEPLDRLVHGQDWEVHGLGEHYALYMVPCAAGAYNFSYAFYVGTEGEDSYLRLLFVDYSDRYGWEAANQLFNPSFDDTTLTLRSFYKLRGLADCGTSGVWRWDEYAFALVAFYAQGECDGTIEPGNFPQIWPPPGSSVKAPPTARRR